MRQAINSRSAANAAEELLDRANEDRKLAERIARHGVVVNPGMTPRWDGDDLDRAVRRAAASGWEPLPPADGPRRAPRRLALAPGQVIRVPAGVPFILAEDALITAASEGKLPAAAVKRPRRRQPRRPHPVVAGEAGMREKPDPDAASSAAGLVATLAAFRKWSGDYSLDDIVAQSGAFAVSRSTLDRALKGPRLPSLKAVMAVIAGCGGSELDLADYADAWRRIKAHRGAASPASRLLRSLPRAVG